MQGVSPKVCLNCPFCTFGLDFYDELKTSGPQFAKESPLEMIDGAQVLREFIWKTVTLKKDI